MRTSVWVSADPILAEYMPTGNAESDKKLPGMGGVFNPINLGMFTYTFNNPLNLIDPTGNDTRPAAGNLTDGYGYRFHPTSGEWKDHEAIDITNPTGAPVIAKKSGVVINIRQNEGNEANCVTIMYDREDGEEQTYGAYSHTASDAQIGDRFDEAEPIGTTDESGNSTGGHLHYEMLDSEGDLVNPTQNFNEAEPYHNNYYQDQAERNHWDDQQWTGD